MTPRISVLMPAYNAEKYISESIESILCQSYTDFELIILDDGSTDKTGEIIKSFQRQDSRIRIFHNKHNAYIALARNRLIHEAGGGYVAWQDADDISFPDRLYLQSAYLDTHPHVGIVGGYLAFYNGIQITSVRKYHEQDEPLRRDIFRYSPVAQPAAMIRRVCFEKARLYNPAYPPAEDIDMSFKIGESFQFANIQRPVIKYRITRESATWKHLSKIKNATFNIRFKNRHNPAYTLRFSDIMYNTVQLILSYILPDPVQIKLFTLFRNSKYEPGHENI